MNKNLLFFLAAVFLASTAFLHVLKTSEGLRVYQKDRVSLKDTWLDLTALGMADLRHHTDVVTLLLRRGDERFLPGGAVLRGLYDLGLDMAHALEQLDGEIKVSESLGELKKLGARKAGEAHQKIDELGRSLSDSTEKLKGLLTKP